MASTTLSPARPRARHVPFLRALISCVLAVVIATAINIILARILPSLLGVSPRFPPLRGSQIVMTFTLIGTTVGAIVYLLLSRILVRPAATFTVGALIALALSWLPDLAMLGKAEAARSGLPALAASIVPVWGPFGRPFPATNLVAIITLMFLHLVAATILINMAWRLEGPA